MGLPEATGCQGQEVGLVELCFSLVRYVLVSLAEVSHILTPRLRSYWQTGVGSSWWPGTIPASQTLRSVQFYPWGLERRLPSLASH